MIGSSLCSTFPTHNNNQHLFFYPQWSLVDSAPAIQTSLGLDRANQFGDSCPYSDALTLTSDSIAMKREFAIFSTLCFIEFALISVIHGFAPIIGERTSLKCSMVACCGWYSALHLILSLFVIWDVDLWLGLA